MRLARHRLPTRRAPAILRQRQLVGPPAAGAGPYVSASSGISNARSCASQQLHYSVQAGPCCSASLQQLAGWSVPDLPTLGKWCPSLGSQGCRSNFKVPAAWREQLAARGVRTGRSLLHHEVAAADGTRKFLLQVRAQINTNNLTKRAVTAG